MSARQVVFITGATSGFGEACARRYATSGCALVLVGRRQDRLEALKEQLGSTVHAVTLDVRDLEAVQNAVSALPAEFAAVDVLINNAGLALGMGPAQSADMQEWETMVDTNIKGVMYCTRALLPGMVQRNRGHIVNLGSIAATWPYGGGNVYGATKAFVQQFSRNLRCDLLGTGVRVTCIEPGLAETEFSVVRFSGDEQKAKGVYAGMTPLNADDIADAIHWCTSRPAHVNINAVEIMPVAQAFGGLAVHRQK